MAFLGSATFLFLFIHVIPCVFAGDNDLLVETMNGFVFGARAFGAQRFLGMPFAQPPVHNLRWAPPLPPTNWSGIRNASAYAHNCATTSGDYVADLSEDCLYLNVYRPDNTTNAANLPVMLFLYGGSFVEGGTSLFVYDGSYVSRHGNVIFVTSNYRLGPFGFLGSPLLAKVSPDNSTGNYGLQDQRSALEW